MFGNTTEMTDVRAMKTCIALSWISWILAWPVDEYILYSFYQYVFLIFLVFLLYK